jgi:hypothetical protein
MGEKKENPEKPKTENQKPRKEKREKRKEKREKEKKKKRDSVSIFDFHLTPLTADWLAED